MSGIIDPKSRVMDTIVTLEGRKQIANAKLKIEYVSFTDNASYYSADLVSGSANASGRIHLEQCHLPQDQITFEADDSGRLKAFKNSDNVSIKDGQIIQYSFDASSEAILSGASEGIRILNGDEFASTVESLLASSINNFNKLMLIGTKDRIFEDEGFSVSDEYVEFVIHNDRPLSDQTTHVANINQMESLFQDVRMSKVDNFKYLPPINKVDDESIDKRDFRNVKQYNLGNYVPWGRTHIDGLSPEQLEFELSYYEQLGYSKIVNFDPTSIKNTLMGQFFELNFNVMKKLDVIDYGKYVWQGQQKHAFFAGKVLVDDNGTHTFVHLFTLIFG